MKEAEHRVSAGHNLSEYSMEGNAEDDRFSKAAVHRTIAKWSKPTKFHKPFYFISIADTQLGKYYCVTFSLMRCGCMHTLHEYH